MLCLRTTPSLPSIPQKRREGIPSCRRAGWNSMPWLHQPKIWGLIIRQQQPKGILSPGALQPQAASCTTSPPRQTQGKLQLLLCCLSFPPSTDTRRADPSTFWHGCRRSSISSCPSGHCLPASCLWKMSRHLNTLVLLLSQATLLPALASPLAESLGLLFKCVCKYLYKYYIWRHTRREIRKHRVWSSSC